MTEDAEAERPRGQAPSPDGLFVALVLAPGTYSRNKYFSLFQEASLQSARRRAQNVRSILKDLTEPWPHPGGMPPGPPAILVEEATTEEGVRLVYRVEEFEYTRTAVLTHLEAATLRYALARLGKGAVTPEDRRRVEAALTELEPRGLEASGDTRPEEEPSSDEPPGDSFPV